MSRKIILAFFFLASRTPYVAGTSRHRPGLTCFLCCVMLAFVSCADKKVSDPCCAFSQLTAQYEAGEDQGFLQVEGSTATSFHILDEEGKRIGSQSLNKGIALDPGIYKISVNNSVHVVEVPAGELVRCSTGTLIVSGNTTEYYYVMDSTGQQLGFETLSKSMSFFPGEFNVRVNDTEATAEIKLKELTEIRTGTVLVKGTTNEYYYVLDAGNKQLNFNSLDKPLAFLPGLYEVKVNNTSMKADVRAGKVVELQTGNLLVNGLTDEYYYVTDTTGNALNYQSLNKPLALFPGTYDIKVNNTPAKGIVSAGQTTEFMTGSLMLTGGGTAYYYVFDEDGKQLNYNTLNKSLSFFPSEYTVKLGSTTRKATVTAGQLTTISAVN